MKKTVIKISLIVASIVFVSLCFVFNKYDLEISKELTKLDGYFFEFFDDFGELPVFMGPILFGTVYCFLSKKTIYKLGFAGFTSCVYLVAVYKVFHNMDIDLNITSLSLIISITAILALLNFIVFNKLKRETLENIKDLAILGLITSAVSIACTEVLKLTWGRVRFRDLSSDFSEFTNLFTINGYTGNKSFPSGHTNAGTSILLISLIVSRFTNKKWIKNLVTSLCFVYVAILAFSRIVVSAHYASDVMCGFVVGFTTLCLTYYILKRKGVINVASNKC